MSPQGRSNARWVVLLGSALLFAGCTCFARTPASSPWGTTALSPRETRYVAPYQPPLTATQVPRRAETRPEAGPETTAPADLPELAAPAPSRRPATGPELPAGPALRPEIELNVTAPARRPVDSPAEFRIKLENTGDRLLHNVQIECRFDAGLDFPGTSDKLAVQEFGELNPGAVCSTSISLVPKKKGRQCCEFQVTADGVESVWQSVCLEAMERQVTLELTGPTYRVTGDAADFTVQAVNTTPETLDDVRVQLKFGSELAPLEATEGSEMTSDGLLWKLGAVKAGEGVKLEAQFRCGAATTRACVTADVLVGETVVDNTDVCLEIGKGEGAGRSPTGTEPTAGPQRPRWTDAHGKPFPDAPPAGTRAQR